MECDFVSRRNFPQRTSHTSLPTMNLASLRVFRRSAQGKQFQKYYQAGPSPGFRSRGATSFKYNFGFVQQPRGQTWNGGAQIVNGGTGI